MDVPPEALAHWVPLAPSTPRMITEYQRNPPMTTFKIIRSFHPSLDRSDRTMLRGLTLEQAQSHCMNPKTRKDGVYFDGYAQEK